MALRDLLLRPLRVARLRAYGVHSWDDLLEKWVRSPAFLRPSLNTLRRQISSAVRVRQLLFIHVPRNAGTSISTTLYGAMMRHKTALFYQTVDPEFFSRSNAFATLRDPVERFISAYWFIRNGGGSVIRMGGMGGEWFVWSCRHIKDIDDLLTHIETNIGDKFSLDHVVRPQVWYLCDQNDRLLVNRLFVLERDNTRLAEFLRRYGIDNIPVLNTTLKHQLTLTQAQLERILAIYADDVQLIRSGC